MDTAHL